MPLSETAHRILTEAARHSLWLAIPAKLPTAACQAVLSSLLKQAYVEECPAPIGHIGFGRRRRDGTWTAARVTEAGITAVGAAPSNTAAVDEAEQAVASIVPAHTRQ